MKSHRHNNYKLALYVLQLKLIKADAILSAQRLVNFHYKRSPPHCIKVASYAGLGHFCTTEFNSLKNGITRSGKKLFGPKVELVVNNNEKQADAEDCGLFAIANCICLTEKKSPGNYNQPKMRLHVVNCIENLNLTVFPDVHA